MIQTNNHAFSRKNGDQGHKHDEILVVSLANARSEPRTMVVQPLNATIADSAMDCSWRSVNVTGDAVLDLGQPGVYNIQILASMLDVDLVDLSLIGFEQKVTHWYCCWVLCGRQYQKYTCSDLNDQTEEKEDPS